MEAVDVSDDQAERADLLERVGIAASAAGRIDIAEERLREAIDIVARWATGKVPPSTSLGVYGQQMAARRPAQVIELLGPQRWSLRISATQLASRFSSTSLRAGLAVGAARRSDRLRGSGAGPRRTTWRPSQIADVLISKGSLIRHERTLVRGQRPLRTGQKLAETNGWWQTAIRGLINISAGDFGRDPREGLNAAREAMAMARRFGYRSSLATASGNALEAAARMGEWDWVVTEGRRVMEEDLDEADRINVVRGIEEVMAYRGDGRRNARSAPALRRVIRKIRSDVQLPRRAAAADRFSHDDYVAAAREWQLSADLNSTNMVADIPRAARAASGAGTSRRPNNSWKDSSDCSCTVWRPTPRATPWAPGLPHARAGATTHCSCMSRQLGNGQSSRSSSTDLWSALRWRSRWASTNQLFKQQPREVSSGAGWPRRSAICGACYSACATWSSHPRRLERRRYGLSTSIGGGRGKSLLTPYSDHLRPVGRDPRLYLTAREELHFPFRRLERPRRQASQSPCRRDQFARARVPGPDRRRDPPAHDRVARRDPRGRGAVRAVRGRAQPTRARSAAASCAGRVRRTTSSTCRASSMTRCRRCSRRLARSAGASWACATSTSS